MKRFLIAAAAVALLTGSAAANDASKDHSTHMKSGKVTAHAKHRGAVRTDGYSTNAPTRDYGRYSNLPGKDAVTSKAYIQDH